MTFEHSSDNWLQKEAARDEKLHELILQREGLFSRALEEGKISIHDEAVAQEMARVTQEINQRKQQLGIDPTLEP